MTERILFVTGKLAERRLHKVLAGMRQKDFTAEVRNIGVSVAALMTVTMLRRRLGALDGIDRIVVPGLCRGDLDGLARDVGVPLVRGPVDVKDLPVLFGQQPAPVVLDKHSVRIFAEITDAPMLGVDEIVARAGEYARDGADVIDLGCLPDTPFPHLQDSVAALKGAGMLVSVDSLDEDELLRGGQAGADYLLSLKQSSAWIAEEVAATPVLIAEEPADLASLYQLIEQFTERGRAFIADSILDPIHFGLMASLRRYAELCERYPAVEVMMGIGNLTELTEADTTGINAVLFGVISELGIGNVLTTQVSPHTRGAIREADRARRIMYAAKENAGVPKGVDGGLLSVHERKPFPYDEAEIRELAGQISDPSYRIEVSEGGIHVFNRDGMVSGADALGLFPQLSLLEDDAPHAFYMGVELARAEIALRLGKRYVQDQDLRWGVAVAGDGDGDDPGREEFKEPGPTLSKRRRKGDL